MRLIDADALIETGIRVRGGMISDDHLIYVPMRDVMNSIDKAPTIKIELVRHGRWEFKPDPYGFFKDIPVCSECGCTNRWRETYEHCPHCGAKMDKEET